MTEAETPISTIIISTPWLIISTITACSLSVAFKFLVLTFLIFYQYLHDSEFHTLD